MNKERSSITTPVLKFLLLAYLFLTACKQIRKMKSLQLPLTRGAGRDCPHLTPPAAGPRELGSYTHGSGHSQADLGTLHTDTSN